MAPWVVKVFIQILPKILCIERPKKNDPHDEMPQEVLTDVFHVSNDDDKYTEYGSKRFSGDYGMPGMYLNKSTKCFSFKMKEYKIIIVEI